MLEKNKETMILDVRSEQEYATGRIPGAILLSEHTVRSKAEVICKNKQVPIIVYCRSGIRSKSAARQLEGLGYEKVYDLGGILDWPYELE